MQRCPSGGNFMRMQASRRWDLFASKIPNWLVIIVCYPFIVCTFLLCLTPFTCWSAITRAPLYNFLVKLETCYGKPRRDSGLSPVYSFVWWAVNGPFTVLAMVFLPIGLPLFLWFWLGLRVPWTKDLSGQMQVAQLLSSALLGAVALDVFLWFQLPQLLNPAVLISSVTDELEEHYVRTLAFQRGKETMVAFRIANTGVICFNELHLVLELPEGFEGPTGTRRVELPGVRLAQGETKLDRIPVRCLDSEKEEKGNLRFKATTVECFGTTQIKTKWQLGI